MDTKIEQEAKMQKTISAVSVIVGTVIGAGILGIPYAVMKSGFSIGLLHLIVIACLMILINLYIGEIVLRTKETHQLAGYAEKYLGKKGKTWMMIAFAFGIYSALLAYLIAEGASLSYLIFGTPNYSILLGIVFWIILSLISFKGITVLRKAEPIGIVFVFIMILSIVLLFFSKIKPSNLSYIVPGNFFFPFGVILFAFLGFSAIPEMERILGKDKKRTKSAIWTAGLIALAIYIIFTIVVLGSQGASTAEIATLGLGRPFILLGIITMFNAYLALSVALMDSYRFDYKKSKLASWVSVISVPLVLYALLSLIGLASFIKVIGIGGVISGGLTAVLVLLMLKEAKRSGSRVPEYDMPYSSIIKWTLIAIFVLGALAEIMLALI